MPLIHTPRVLYVLARGWILRNQRLGKFMKARETKAAASPAPSTSSSTVILPTGSGFSFNDPHFYQGRVNVFDYFVGHMNNAAYLTHAELARWEMMSYCGLFPYFRKTGIIPVVPTQMIRYRQEIKPVLAPFTVETFFAGIDSKNIWVIHNFRGDVDDRICAQLLVAMVCAHRRQVLEPGNFLRDAGLDESVIESLKEPFETNADNNLIDMRNRYGNLEDWLRLYASEDDQKVTKNK